ncbi:MAG: AbrB family transcriptional regulator [Pseudomonadota bacterium]
MPSRPDLLITLRSFAVGAVGAGGAYLLSFPLYLITGPAILISLLGVTRMRFAIADPFRDAAFVIIGVSLGSGVNAEAREAFLRWPLAFLALAVMLVIAMAAGRLVLARGFGFDDRSAVLAATPGHLSFVLGISAEIGADVPRIAAVQAVRLLSLTLIVPLIAMAFGVDLGVGLSQPGEAMSIGSVLLLIVLGLGLGLVLKAMRVPAPLMIGPLLVSSVAHLTDLVPGTMPLPVATAGFIAIGTLIGTRFAAISLGALRRSLTAGLVSTSVTAALSALFALPVAWAILMPPAHVLVAFAPGGLETMIAMGAPIGANPGFVAACHVGRLLILSVLMPVFLARAGKAA